MKIPKSEYAKLARKANKAGLTNYDPKNLSVGQKSYLTKLTKDSNPLKQVLNNPRGYSMANVSKRLVKNARLAGSLATNGKIFLRNKILNGKSSFSNFKGEKYGVSYSETLHDITRHFRVFYPGTEGFFKISRELESGKFPISPGEQVTFKIGSNSPFRQSFSDYKTLYNYVNDMQEGRIFRPGSDFGKILPEISFVTITRNKPNGKKKPKARANRSS